MKARTGKNQHETHRKGGGRKWDGPIPMGGRLRLRVAVGAAPEGNGAWTTDLAPKHSQPVPGSAAHIAPCGKVLMVFVC